MNIETSHAIVNLLRTLDNFIEYFNICERRKKFKPNTSQAKILYYHKTLHHRILMQYRPAILHWLSIIAEDIFPKDLARQIKRYASLDKIEQEWKK